VLGGDNLGSLVIGANEKEAVAPVAGTFEGFPSSVFKIWPMDPAGGSESVVTSEREARNVERGRRGGAAAVLGREN